MANYVNKKAAIISDLAACKAAFDKVNIPWIIMGGVVLGYARYEDVMPWDTDLDIAVVALLTVDKRKALNNSLISNGFKLNQRAGDFVYGTRKSPFNGWFFHKNGNFYEAFPKSTPGFKFVEKAVWYDAPQIVDFLGDKYPMPNNIDDYLVCQYGHDWKTNIVKDHEQYFLDKRGSRGTATFTTGRTSKNGDMWPKTLEINDNME